MDNGCVCCSVRGDLVRTFGTLVHKRKDFQAIIIETTGESDSLFPLWPASQYTPQSAAHIVILLLILLQASQIQHPLCLHSTRMRWFRYRYLAVLYFNILSFSRSLSLFNKILFYFVSFYVIVCNCMLWYFVVSYCILLKFINLFTY